MKKATFIYLILTPLLSTMINTSVYAQSSPSAKSEMEAVQFRIARPTNNLKEVVRFYTEGLGLPQLGSFNGHEGYDGVMLGLPDSRHHLEFTQYADPVSLPAPTKENLLVLYYDRPEQYEAANKRLQNMNIKAVAPENPYWIDKSKTYEDPDGWRVVLFNGIYTP
ncbi:MULTISPECIES: VOC family protein [unclassified Sphingobacterium]|uniref:VOC family protein n=1 Tax=unclassified Sphingobacterium TaxID=2609468 RepID=UPI0025F21DF0|nr:MULTISPECIES: VOC family protein [unclassified Sphingobacterium]